MLLEIILIGIALSMDAFAITLSSAMTYPKLKPSKKILMPIFFGVFQGIMPIFGYYLGSLFSVFINKYSPIVAFFILAIIGANMIKEGISGGDTAEREFSIKILLLQAVATSIDAFAVGVSFAALGTEIFSSSAIIAVSTFIITLAALKLGKAVGERLGDKSVILGGIILILIGIKSLF